MVLMCSVLVAPVGTITRSTPWEELPEWMTPTETAAYLGVTTWFVYQRIHQGEIPYRRVGPKIIQIPRVFFHSSNALPHSQAEAQPQREVLPAPHSRPLTKAKRRELIRVVATDVLRETLDRIRKQERIARTEHETECAR